MTGFEISRLSLNKKKKNHTERFDISKELFCSKMSEGSLMRPHVLKMIGFITRLKQLGWTMDHDLSIDLVLTSLLESYSQFVLNFNMNKIETTLLGLLNMLAQAEKTIVKEKPSIHHVFSKERVLQKKKKIKKDKKDERTTSKVLKPNSGVKKDKEDVKGICHHCGNQGIGGTIATSTLNPSKGKK